jgi:hypothetical protein
MSQADGQLEPMAGRQSKLAMLQNSPSTTSLASTGAEPGSSPGNRLLAPSAGEWTSGPSNESWLTVRTKKGLVESLMVLRSMGDGLCLAEF